MALILDESKLGIIRKYWRELCMIALVYTVVFLFKQQATLNQRIYDMQKEEIRKKEEESNFWRDAFITTSKYNKYMQQKDTTDETSH